MYLIVDGKVFNIHLWLTICGWHQIVPGLAVFNMPFRMGCAATSNRFSSVQSEQERYRIN